MKLVTEPVQAIYGFIKDTPNQLNRLGTTLLQGAAVQGAKYADYGAMLSGDRNADQLGNAIRAQAFKDLATPTPDLYEMTRGQKIGAQAVGFALGAESIAGVANFGVTEGPLVAKRFSGLEFDVEGPLSRNPFASFENAASEFEAASVPPAPVLPPVAASGPYIELGS